MRLSQLEYLVSLHQYGTFSRAAEALFVSQPAVSVAIRELEEELGYPLLVRGRRRLSFTPEGRRVLEHARAILREEEAMRAIGGGRETLRGSFVMGSSPHFCASILLEAQLRLEREQPGLSVTAREGDGPALLRGLESGDLHLALVQLCDLDEDAFWPRVRQAGLEGRVLFTEEMCAAVGEDHPLAGRSEVPFRELAAYPYGTFRGAMNQQIRRLLSQTDRPRIFAMEEIGPLRQLLFRQNAYTVIPRRALYFGNRLFNSRLRALSIQGVELASPMVLLRGPAAQNAAGEALCQAIQAACEDYLLLGD